MEEGRVSVMITEYGKKCLPKVLTYFDTNALSVVKQYSKNLLEHIPGAPLAVVTIIEVTSSGNQDSTLALVTTAITKINESFPGAVALYE